MLPYHGDRVGRYEADLRGTGDHHHERQGAGPAVGTELDAGHRRADVDGGPQGEEGDQQQAEDGRLAFRSGPGVALGDPSQAPVKEAVGGGSRPRNRWRPGVRTSR